MQPNAWERMSTTSTPSNSREKPFVKSTTTLSRIQLRREKVKELAYEGKTRREISKELGLTYQTTCHDLKLLGIIPATNYNKENA
jgi:hypothetical protein